MTLGIRSHIDSNRMNKTNLQRSLLLILLSIVVAGCSTTRHSAPVVDLGNAGSRAGSDTGTGTTRAPDAPGYYTVKKGDTLLRIALEFGQNYRDLVVWNQLANPNDIRVDQVLRVLPPNGAAQTGSVAAGSGVEVRPLNSPAPAVAQSSVAVKTGPRGDKRPYSDAALAELQKAESSTTSAPVGRSESSKTSDKAAEKAAEKAGDKTATESSVADENIGFIWPAEGKVVGSFEDGKKGIDIAGKSGQTVQAAAAGKVMYAGSGIRGYGNLVIVKHSNSLLSAYAHNKSILVKEGQNVSKGEKIAEMGNSDADSVKLHFEIRQQGKPVDPSKFLPAK